MPGKRNIMPKVKTQKQVRGGRHDVESFGKSECDEKLSGIKKKSVMQDFFIGRS